jgi:hypothetical protein
LPEGWKYETEPLGEVSAVHDVALSGLDDLFDRRWNLIAAELQRTSLAREKDALARLVGKTCVCLVHLPTGYQGLQCRRSADIEDRHLRFVANGATVVGVIIEDGKWLQMSRSAFLPTYIGPIQVLQPRTHSHDHSDRIVRKYTQQEETFRSWTNELERTRTMHSARSLECGIFSCCNGMATKGESF